MVPDAGFATRILAEGTDAFNRLVGGQLTVPIGLLALLLSLVLGAAHAALPGHGKTIMAAYMVGTRGTPKDAFVIGVTVTFAHTAGVLVLGLLFQAGSSVAGESLLAILGVVSGLLVTVIGVGLLRSAVRGSGYDMLSAGHDHGHDHGHVHSDGDHNAHGQGHSHDDDQSHGREHSHPAAAVNTQVPAAATVARHSDWTSETDATTHHHRPADMGYKRLTLVGMGLAGGLVPSPSALVVLLASIGLGRTGFGVALVLGYGAGMAATLIAVGYVIARVPGRLGGLRRFGQRPSIARIVRLGPVITAALVLLVGLGLALRSAAPLV